MVKSKPFGWIEWVNLGKFKGLHSVPADGLVNRFCKKFEPLADFIIAHNVRLSILLLYFWTHVQS